MFVKLFDYHLITGNSNSSPFPESSFSERPCGGLTLAGGLVLTKAALSLPPLSWTGDRKYNKGLVGRDKDRRDHSPVTITGKTDSAWGKLTQFITNQPE